MERAAEETTVTQPKRIEYVDGVRILIGFSDEEYKELLIKEAIEAFKQQYWQQMAQQQPAQKRRRKAS